MTRLSPDTGPIAIARVLKPIGLKGQVLVEPLTDFPDRFSPGKALLLEGEPRTIQSSSRRKARWALKLEGIDSRTDAESLRDMVLHIEESDIHDLGPRQYYRFQLLGLEVYTVGGQLLGEISDVLETGSNDVYVVAQSEGELLIPATSDVVREVDLEGGRLVADVPTTTG